MSLHEQFADRSVWTGTVPALEEAAPPRPLIREDSLEQILKRALDLAIALPLLVVLAPVLGAIALWIAGDSEGPVLFRQTRRGLGGKPFEILKFRTMTVLENGASVVQATQNDPRVTAAGCVLRKTSLDELPQLLNVIKGEMSLVGPRPHALAHDDDYARRIEGYTLRQAVKPGITGWAQINGSRGETPTLDSMKRRVRLDAWYASNASLALDLEILARTPLEVLRGRNAH
ncbi:MAG: exopolysaccharide biosynthesis polyprenyl glycosylphosphotransferase [Rhizomicrobium sp.]